MHSTNLRSQILRSLIMAGSLASAMGAAAAPEPYTIDSEHTFPSFEADHMGLSVWRGKMNKSAGTVVLDKAGHSGSVAVTIDLNKIGRASCRERVYVLV